MESIDYFIGNEKRIVLLKYTRKIYDENVSFATAKSIRFNLVIMRNLLQVIA